MQHHEVEQAAAHPRRALIRQAIPILVGQLAVMANGLVDSMMAGHAGSDVLAAMAVGSSVYISLYVGLMGVIIGLTPICSGHYGAGQYAEVGKDAAQGVWIALLLSALGLLVLFNPDFLFSITATPPSIATAAKGYLTGIGVGLPAALVFRVFYAMNQSISRPGVVMALQVLMLALKVPLNVWFMQGGWGLPALGAAGFGWATALTMWVVLGVSVVMWKTDTRYAPFRIHRWVGPDAKRLLNILKLGLPIGGSYLIEVTSFTFIALLVSRFGVNQVGSHQIVSNMAAVAYMMCLAMGNATTVMAAQQLGAGAPRVAVAMVKRGLELAMGIATLVCVLFYVFDRPLIELYTQDETTIAVALSLMPWVIAYHFIDAIQTVCSFSLRAYKVSGRPMLIYFMALWVVGIGGGMWLGVWQASPLQAKGFWMAGVAGLLLAALGLGSLLVYTIRRSIRQAAH
ncbi:MATE family efflux transporter [Limnobacter humi]|uniref:Multidrug-efflux transporter n=1 Tax=Limnobacter humi TaxID=1778671 RepID=A0ABT1WK75_9BURK|nr:MATE family efflux transporter [Limnobacter humi]MCQ8896889.1 MATE family efflux transporter [Limnobacter humi]